jgi:hypothetical protein
MLTFVEETFIAYLQRWRDGNPSRQAR